MAHHTITLDTETGHITLADGTVLRPADVISTQIPTTWVAPETMTDLTIGQTAYVPAMGAGRQGYIIKLGRTRATVRYTTASSPDRWYDKAVDLSQVRIAPTATPAPEVTDPQVIAERTVQSAANALYAVATSDSPMASSDSPEYAEAEYAYLEAARIAYTDISADDMGQIIAEGVHADPSVKWHVDRIRMDAADSARLAREALAEDVAYAIAQLADESVSEGERYRMLVHAVDATHTGTDADTFMTVACEVYRHTVDAIATSATPAHATSATPAHLLYGVRAVASVALGDLYTAIVSEYGNNIDPIAVVTLWEESGVGTTIADAVGIHRVDVAQCAMDHLTHVAANLPMGTTYSSADYRQAKADAFHALGRTFGDLSPDAIWNEVKATGQPLSDVVTRLRAKGTTDQVIGEGNPDPLPAHAAAIMDALDARTQVPSTVTMRVGPPVPAFTTPQVRESAPVSATLAYRAAVGKAGATSTMDNGTMVPLGEIHIAQEAWDWQRSGSDANALGILGVPVTGDTVGGTPINHTAYYHGLATGHRACACLIDTPDGALNMAYPVRIITS